MFNGPPPTILALPTHAAEIGAVAQWLQARTQEGIVPHEVGIFVRSEAELPRARGAAEVAGCHSRFSMAT